MYELLFWKYADGIYLNHHEVYEAIDEDKSILVDLVNKYENNDTDKTSNFIKQFTRYVDASLFTLFPKQNDARIADAINELFKKSENLDIFNKKALYIYIKEMTDATTPQITKIIKRLKLIYIRKYNEFYEYGYISFKS
jgi:hypothetical protein